jgi:hypothetical protein
METLRRLVILYFAKSHIRRHHQFYRKWLKVIPKFLRPCVSQVLSEEIELGIVRLNALEYRRNYEDMLGEERLRCYTRCDFVVFFLTVFLGFFFFGLLLYGLINMGESSSSQRDSFYYRRSDG